MSIRKDYGAVAVAEMFSRYRQMYLTENVPVEKIAAFTAEPTDKLLQAVYAQMPAANKYRGAANVSVNFVRRLARELAPDKHKFQPMHMVRDTRGIAHLLNGRHAAIELVVLGVESPPLVELIDRVAPPPGSGFG